jgi:lipoprotein-anchoring transpeptidase ErfK/SrfK
MNKISKRSCLTNVGSGLGLAGAAFVMVAVVLSTNSAQAQVLATLAGPNVAPPQSLSEPIATPDIPARLRRQVVDYSTAETRGTVIVDTPNTYLYFVLGGGKAIRYGIGVGRDGFTWSGTKTIERKSEWPDWLPPADMLARQPYLPRFMAGGPGNPLGARAMYLSGTIYRIHGTNKPSSIGTHVSSGCIRMLNEDVTDLYNRTRVGTRVVVLPMNDRHIAMASLTTATGARERAQPFAASLR